MQSLTQVKLLTFHDELQWWPAFYFTVFLTTGLLWIIWSLRRPLVTFAWDDIHLRIEHAKDEVLNLAWNDLGSIREDGISFGLFDRKYHERVRLPKAGIPEQLKSKLTQLAAGT